MPGSAPTTPPAGRARAHSSGPSGRPRHTDDEGGGNDSYALPRCQTIDNGSMVPRSTAAGEDGDPTPRRRNSAGPRRVVAKVTTKRRAVRTGLLARIFFPHYSDHTPAMEGGAGQPQLSSKPGKRISTLVKRPAAAGEGGGAVTPQPGDIVECPPRTQSGVFGEDGEGDDDADMPQEELTVSRRIANLIQSRTVQTCFLFLLVLDVLIVIAEILILTFVSIHTEIPGPATAHHAPAATATTLPPPTPTTHAPTPSVHHAAPHHYEVPAHCANTSLVKISAPHGDGGHADEYWIVEPAGCPIGVYLGLSHALHTAEVALAWCSRIILWLFGLELIILLATLRLEFLLNPMYDLDFVIIAVAVILDAVIWANHAHEEPAVGLILLLRCWRFARILHGVGLSVHEVDEIEFHEHEAEHERLFHHHDGDDAHDVKKAGATTTTTEPFASVDAETAPKKE